VKRSNESSLKEVIDQLIETYKLRDKLNEVKIRRAWELIMGNAVSNRTTAILIKEGVLHLRISSAALREELTFQRARILELMNKELGGEFLKSVVIN
jgi:hypothetical protein